MDALDKLQMLLRKAGKFPKPPRDKDADGIPDVGPDERQSTSADEQEMADKFNGVQDSDEDAEDVGDGEDDDDGEEEQEGEEGDSDDFGDADDGDGSDEDADGNAGEGAEDEEGEADASDQQQSGEVANLVQQLAAAEKDFYAARGMHGAGHAKADVAMDTFHKLVRKLARTVAGQHGVDLRGGKPQQAEQRAGEDAAVGADAKAEKQRTQDESESDSDSASKKFPFAKKSDAGGEDLRKAGEFIDWDANLRKGASASVDLVKAGATKYISRKRVGNHWVYTYPHPLGGEHTVHVQAEGHGAIADHEASANASYERLLKETPKLHQQVAQHGMTADEHARAGTQYRADIPKHKAAGDRKNALRANRMANAHFMVAMHLKRQEHAAKNTEKAMRDPIDLLKSFSAKRFQESVQAYAEQGAPEVPEPKRKKASKPKMRLKGKKASDRNVQKSAHDASGRALRKGWFSYSAGGNNPIPDEYLYDYLCGAIEEAYEQERAECAHKNVEASDQVDYFARCVMNELVSTMRVNKDLLRAAKKFNVTKTTVAALLVSQGILKPDSDTMAVGSGDGNSAMGGSTIAGEVMALSRKAPWVQTDPFAPTGVPTKPREPENVAKSIVDDRIDPAVSYAGARREQFRRLWNGVDPVAAPNYNAACPVHGRDIAKATAVSNPMTPCTCAN